MPAAFDVQQREVTRVSIPMAYIGVIIIWSTTPLAIQWSGDGVGYLFGITSRMILGMLVGLMVAGLFSIPLPWHAEARRTYLAAGLGVFFAMTSVYWSSQFIPSGWISVLFGLAPIVTGLLATFLLAERALDAADSPACSWGSRGWRSCCWVRSDSVRTPSRGSPHGVFGDGVLDERRGRKAHRRGCPGAGHYDRRADGSGAPAGVAVPLHRKPLPATVPTRAMVSMSIWA